MEYKGPRSWAGPGMTKHTVTSSVKAANQESMKYQKGGKQRADTHANKGSGLINEGWDFTGQ
jgi:hypothetical protein